MRARALTILSGLTLIYEWRLIIFKSGLPLANRLGHLEVLTANEQVDTVRTMLTIRQVKKAGLVEL